MNTGGQGSLFGKQPDAWSEGTWSAGQLAWLLTLPGVGQGRVRTIVSRWPSAETFARDDAREWAGSWARKLPSEIGEYEPPPGIRIVGLFDEDYPALLREIPDPPPVLWYRGALPETSRAIAVVGTRHPDDFGIEVARVAAEATVATGGVVVSGLALGCDAVAHQAALDAGGETVAVLGGSLSHPSPAANRKLAERILDSGGALATEVPPEARVFAGSLISRNRIQSGLSKATVIAQTGIPGGTLHTAGFTLEQRRRLIVAVPKDQWASDRAAGNLALADSSRDRSDVLPRRFQARFKGRMPLADTPVRRKEELVEVIREVLHGV